MYTTRRPPTFIIVLILDPYLNNWVLVVFKALQGIAMHWLAMATYHISQTVNAVRLVEGVCRSGVTDLSIANKIKKTL